MNQTYIEQLRTLIRTTGGMSVCGSEDYSGQRQGLRFWFENYNRSNGPVFIIKPSGLIRHIVSLQFGVYAAPCITHIQKCASGDAYRAARAILARLAQHYDVKLNGELLTHDWKVTTGFSVEISRKMDQPNAQEAIAETVKQVMVPLMVVIAELIGYESEIDPEIHGVEEGALAHSFLSRRERNPRNRIMCLSLHGEYCGVCGLDMRDTYGDEYGSILEVHHIEPLSEIGEPKIYNPYTDLIPLCPNCHRVIHKRTPAFTPDELREYLDL